MKMGCMKISSRDVVKRQKSNKNNNLKTFSSKVARFYEISVLIITNFWWI